MREFIVKPEEIVAVPIANNTAYFPVRRVYCVGRNYRAHAIEMGSDPNREPPFFFCKPDNAIVVAEQDQCLKLPYPTETKELHFEMELVIAIGKEGAYIPVDEAMNYVLGYACGLDMTRRDLQSVMKDTRRPWEIGKAFDFSAPIAPIHLLDKENTINNANIWLTVNGEIRQSGNINQLIWNIPEVISHLSKYFTLKPGDLIYTGTPEGVGSVGKGDILEGYIDGLTPFSIEII